MQPCGLIQGYAYTSAIRKAHGNAAQTKTRMASCVSIFQKEQILSTHSADDLEAVAVALNTRPRKSLNWRTPAEALDQHLPRDKLAALRRSIESPNMPPRITARSLMEPP